MFYIVFVILLFIALVGAHIFFCRKTTKPGLQAKAFILMAMIFLGIYAVGVKTPLITSLLDPHSLWGFPFRITAGVIFVLLVPVYLIFYVLTQQMSPSKKILLTIAQRGEASLPDILASVEDEDFITNRLSDLCMSGCVRFAEGRYTLSALGQKIAVVLNIMQHILGRDIGG